MADDLTAVVMAGGLGTRMKSATPKHLHTLLGRRMVDWVIDAARGAGVERIVVVASPDSADSYDGLEVAIQEQPLGTGDAVRAARSAIAADAGDVLVLNGDVPALTPELVRALVASHREAQAAATVLAFEPADPRSYGRIVRDGDGRLARIVEAADATADELALTEVNSGIYAFRGDKLWPVLDRLQAHNAQGELYVTDTLGLLVGDGEVVAVHTAPDPLEVEGINTRAELALAAEPHQRGAHARRRHDRRPRDDVDRRRRRDRAGHDDPPVHGSARADPDRVGRGDRPLRLRAPTHRDRSGREDRRVRRGEGVDDRRAHEGAAPLLHRRRGDRGGYEHRGRQHHRQLQARARRAQGEDPHRE